MACGVPHVRSSVIAADERTVEKLERQNLLAQEKVSRCGIFAKSYDVAKSYDETFRTAFEFFASRSILCKKIAFEDKKPVLNLTLNNPFVHDRNPGVQTAVFSISLMLFESESHQKKLMAERVGFAKDHIQNYNQ